LFESRPSISHLYRQNYLDDALSLTIGTTGLVAVKPNPLSRQWSVTMKNWKSV